MDRSDIIYLIADGSTKNTDGIWVKPSSAEKRKVYCQVDSVTRAEWFEGGRNGLNPQYRFTMFKYDYQNEQVIEYNGINLYVYRTYEGKNDTIELYTEYRKGTDANPQLI